MADKGQRVVTRGGGSEGGGPTDSGEEDTVAAVRGQPFRSWRNKKDRKKQEGEAGNRSNGGSGGGGNGGSGGNSGNGGRKNTWHAVEICSRHLRFGADAWTCQDPARCKFPGN